MRVVVTMCVLVLFPASLSAQIGNPAGMAPDTKMEKPGVPAANQTNYQDRLFAQLATVGGIAEVEFGQLAEEKADDDRVRQFAGRMVNDHGRANEELKSIADKSKTPLPTELGPDQKAVRADLEKREGVEFDLAYMTGQIVDHQKIAQLLAWEIGSGQDAELQRFAARTLPTVLEHLDMAKQIHAELTGQIVVRPSSAN
jgi:putative membrane protein